MNILKFKLLTYTFTMEGEVMRSSIV